MCMKIRFHICVTLRVPQALLVICSPKVLWLKVCASVIQHVCVCTSASSTILLPSGQMMWSTWERTLSQVSSGVRRLAYRRKRRRRTSSSSSSSFNFGGVFPPLISAELSLRDVTDSVCLVFSRTEILKVGHLNFPLPLIQTVFKSVTIPLLFVLFLVLIFDYLMPRRIQSLHHDPCVWLLLTSVILMLHSRYKSTRGEKISSNKMWLLTLK